MSAGCYVCGSPDIAAAADLRNPTCEGCKPARDHTVSMQTGAGGSSLAVCQCGWRSEVSGKGRSVAQDAKVKGHWRAMIRFAARQPLAFAAMCIAAPTIVGNVLVTAGWPW